MLRATCAVCQVLVGYRAVPRRGPPRVNPVFTPLRNPPTLPPPPPPPPWAGFQFLHILTKTRAGCYRGHPRGCVRRHPWWPGRWAVCASSAETSRRSAHFWRCPLLPALCHLSFFAFVTPSKRRQRRRIIQFIFVRFLFYFSGCLKGCGVFWR